MSAATTPTRDQLLLVQHVLEVVSRLPADLRGLIWRDDGVTFEMSAEQYARQCHVGTLRGSATITYTELLSRSEPLPAEEDPSIEWDPYTVERLLKERWEADLAERRKHPRSY